MTTAPVNDDFENATPLSSSDGLNFVATGTFVGATTEPTEFDTAFGDPGEGAELRGLWAHTVWHRWVVPAALDGQTIGWGVTCPRGVDPNVNAFLWKSTTGGIGDTMDNIALTYIVAAGETTFIGTQDLVAGDVYYFQPFEIAADDPPSGPGLTTYTLRVGPSQLPPPPPQLYPLLPKAVNGIATVSVVEAIGYAPDRMEGASLIRLGDRDDISLRDFPIVRNADGSPAYSMERWLRVIFEPPFTKITNLRIWSSDYAPTSGWAIRWGTTDSYRKPSRSASSIAVLSMPTHDTGRNQLGAVAPATPGDSSMVSLWLVLQAVCTRGQAGVLQAVAPHLKFAWTET